MADKAEQRSIDVICSCFVCGLVLCGSVRCIICVYGYVRCDNVKCVVVGGVFFIFPCSIYLRKGVCSFHVSVMFCIDIAFGAEALVSVGGVFPGRVVISSLINAFRVFRGVLFITKRRLLLCVTPITSSPLTLRLADRNWSFIYLFFIYLFIFLFDSQAVVVVHPAKSVSL